MTTAYRANRKVSDADLLRLNSVGLSLRTISEILKCHQSTLTLRLKDLGVPPADTRHSFMEDVFSKLSPDEQEWLADQLSGTTSIKDFLRLLIKQEHARHLLNQGKNP